MVIVLCSTLMLCSSRAAADDTKPPKGKLTEVKNGIKDACSKKNVVSIAGRNGRSSKR
jgi:hypothetical protein